MKYFMMALLLETWSSTIAQVNYVLNPSFEEYTQCPNGYNQIAFAKYWSSPDSNYAYPSPCFPEYLNTCSTNFAVSVPDDQYFWQFPATGNGMAQIIAFYDETVMPYELHRDYLQGRLYKTLIAGKSYCVRFYVNYEEGSSYAIKDISAYLDNGSIDTSQTCGQPQTRYLPQVSNTGGIITDTMNWTKIEGSFISTGNERFITLGNYKDKAHTTYVATPVGPKYITTTGSSWGYYLIDDVSVIESDLPADAGSDRHIGKGDSTYLGRPKEVGLECTWTILENPSVIGNGGGIWVKPNIATSYVVTQTLCGQIKMDTVKVEVWGVGINSINGQEQLYSLSPIPGDGIIHLSQAVNDEMPVSITVYEATGKAVYSGKALFGNGSASLDLTRIVPGFYNVQLQDNKGNTYKLKWVKL